MKKIIIAVISAVVVLVVAVASIIIIVNNDKDEMIIAESSDWQSVYYVGEEINLKGLFVQYYPDFSDDEDNFATVQATLSMVSGFDSSTVGKKQITLNYNGLQSLPIDYEVVEVIDLSVNATYLVEDNLAISINTQEAKAIIVKYSSVCDFINGSGAVTEKPLTFGVHKNSDGEYARRAKFEYEQKTYYFQMHGDGYIFKIIEQGSVEGGVSSNERNILARTLNANEITLPVLNVVYESAENNGSKAIALFLNDYSVNVYIVNAGESYTPEQLLDQAPEFSLAENTSVITYSKTVRYTKTDGDQTYTVRIKADGSVIVRKDSNATKVYEYNCVHNG